MEGGFYEDDFYLYDEDKLHRMAMRYRKISSQIIQLYLDSCHFGEQHIIQSMIQENALTDHVVNYRDANGRTGLSYACEYGYDDIVRTLARCGDGVCDPNVADKDGNNALIYAAQDGHELCVSILLDYFPTLNLDHINHQGLNALMKAAVQGNSECARLLILSGLSPFVGDAHKNFTPDRWAAFCGRNSTADLIRRLKVTLGPKLCSQCGYTKPLDNCPGHPGLCKTHTPNTSRLDLTFQFESTVDNRKVKLSTCEIIVRCPSGNIIDVIIPSIEVIDLSDTASRDDNHAKRLLDVDKQLEASASLPELNSSKDIQKEQTHYTSTTNVTLKKKRSKKNGFRRFLSFFGCYSSSKDFLNSEYENGKRSSKSDRNGSLKTKHSYSRHPQISRRISFSS